MNNLLPFQFTCQDQPEWMTEIFPEIEDNSEEIILKEFIENVDENNGELLRDMIIYDNNYYSYKYYKSSYNINIIYYYKWSGIEYFYFNSDLEEEIINSK